MCTAIRYENLFGRNFDLDFEFEQNILFTPRNYVIKRRNAEDIKKHYALMGMGICTEGFPLYYDAANEHGLAMAGLNFPGYAKYNEPEKSKESVATFELIPTILGKCRSVTEAAELINNINITSVPFSEVYPVTPLHWMIADKNSALVLECDERGMKLYTDTADLLTNSPSYDIQLFNLSNYMSVSPQAPENRFSDKLPLSAYSFGMGGAGLPGDFSSMSRFVKGTFLLHNSPKFESSKEKTAHFFRLLYAVAMTKGAVQTENGHEFTQYSSAIDLDRLIYSFTSYNSLAPREFSLSQFDAESDTLQIKQ